MKVTIQQNTLKAIALFASDDQTRYSLNGVHIDARKDAATLIATDGRMLALIHAGVVHDKGVATINRATITAALHLCDPVFGDTPITFSTSGNCSIAVSVGGDIVMLDQGLITSPFPNFRQVFPEKGATRDANDWLCFAAERFQKFADAGALLSSKEFYLMVSPYGKTNSEYGVPLGIQLSGIPNFFGMLMSAKPTATPSLPEFLYE
jgi:DNA polymerase III sliding clamp (beta) subunit (PCNA family)